MAWVKISDDFSTHPKILGLTHPAYRALVDSYCYASRHYTDGFVPDAAVKHLPSSTPKVRRELVDRGVWNEVAGGVQIHDYLDYNLSREEAGKLREKRRESGVRGAQKRWQT